MAKSMNDILHPKGDGESTPEFPYAPEGWSKEAAVKQAQEEDIELTGEHWATVRALQEYFDRHDTTHIHARELHDALDEKFHSKGGIKYLYQLFPGGPVAQGCRIAGLNPPAGTTDESFGSVQ